MSIKVTNLRAVNHDICLREKDIQSVTSIANSYMNKDSVSEGKLVRMAYQILHAASRNEIARGNENNITVITDLIIADTESGDIITIESCRELLHNNGIKHEYATRNAIIYALRDLVKNGYLAGPESMADDNSDRWGRRRYVKAYKVR
jgi:hypothetical protein